MTVFLAAITHPYLNVYGALLHSFQPQRSAVFEISCYQVKAHISVFILSLQPNYDLIAIY
jgi:hypothetical protein